MGCLCVSFVLPLLPAPHGWSWRSSVRPEPVVTAAVQPKVEQALPVITYAEPVVEEKQPPVQKVRLHKAKKRPAAVVEAPVVSETVTTDRPVVAAVSPSLPHVEGQVDVAKEDAGVDWARLFSLGLRWIFYAYCFGVVFFGANFLLQLVILLFQSYANPVIRDGRFRIVEMSGNRAPCSFGNTIFINPASYDWETYNQILIHEKTHVSGRHTVDILLAELAVVLQWFNPFAWLYRREVENNLEFLTDEAVLLHREVERSAYQLSLLRVSAPHLPFSITNNYNQSLLKRRIVMMNSKPSSRYTIWKYFFLVPIFTGLVCILNEPLAYGQEVKPATAPKVKKATPASAAHPATAPKTANPAPAAAPVTPAPAAAASHPAVTVTTEGTGTDENVEAVVALQNQMAANASLETTQATLAYLNTNVTTTLNAADVINTQIQARQALAVPLAPISPKFSFNETIPSVTAKEITEGSWFITTSDNKLWVELKAGDDDHNWSSSFHIEKSEINPFPGSGNVTFKLVRDAGTMTFTGQFDGQQGFGHFNFAAAEGYSKALEEMGVTEMEGRRDVSFFLSDVKKDYASMVLHNGYPHITARNLLAFSSMRIDQEFIQYWRGASMADIEDPRTLITLKAMKIDRAYVEEMKAAGYDHLTSRQLSSLKSMHIDGAYVRSMGKGKDNETIPVEQLVSYKAMNIDADYISSLKKVGFGDLGRHEITSLYSMKVTADYIKGFQDIGYKELSARDIIQFKSQGITPEYVKSLRDQGFKDLSAREIVQFKAMKITPEFIKGFRDIGYSDVSMSRLNALKAQGITPEYVAEFKKLGFKDIPVNMLSMLKSTGVNADYISKMREKGFVTDDLNKYIRLKRDFE
ncbi:MAG: hypothetical protein JST68_24970 [Bacteroidetes bacterium]|nr:hypothetical protein [Bacteroidota bacterium]